MPDPLFKDLVNLQDGGNRAMVAATAATIRLDEACRSSLRDTSCWIHGARRRAAIAAAVLDGGLVRMDTLCRLLSDRDWTGADRNVRFAAASWDALAEISGWTGSPSPAAVIQSFLLADGASGRLMKPEVQWSLEEDANWLSELLSGFAEAPDPWKGIEVLRAVWTSNRFFGKSRKVASLTSPWVIGTAFGCGAAMYGFSTVAAREPEALREASRDGDGWFATAAAAIAEGVTAEIGFLRGIAATRATVESLCPPPRAGTSHPQVVDWLFRSPVFSARQLSEEIGLSVPGTKIVLDRMTVSGVLDVDAGSRNRKYSCRRTM